MKKVMLVYGLLTLASVLLYVFAGVTWWAPIQETPSAREFGVIMFHWFGFVALCASGVMSSLE